KKERWLLGNRWREAVKVFLFFFVMIIFICVAMQWNFFALSNNRSFSFASNCTLSADYFASVKHGFFCSIKKGISGHQLTIHLKELFPILDTVSIAHYPCGDIIRFKPHSPLFIVNQEWVLTENKQLF